MVFLLEKLGIQMGGKTPNYFGFDGTKKNKEKSEKIIIFFLSSNTCK